MSILYLLDVTFTSVKDDDFYTDIFKHRSRAMHRFKVLGENRMVAVVSGHIEHVLQTVPSETPCNVSCTPLIDFYDFAVNTLHVEGEEWNTGNGNWPFDKSQETFWVTFKMDYDFHSQEEFAKAWHDHAVAFLKEEHGDKPQAMRMYKSCAMKEVHLLIQTSTSQLDRSLFHYPAIQTFGDHMDVVTRAVDLM